MVLPGGSRASRLILDRLSDGVSLRRAKGSDAKRKPAVAERQDLRRQQPGIGRSGRADALQLKRLKKKKLYLKDEISRIEDQLLPDIIS